MKINSLPYSKNSGRRTAPEAGLRGWNLRGISVHHPAGNNLTATTLEVQHAGDLGPVGVMLHNPALVVVQDAPVARHGSTGLDNDQVVNPGDTIGVGHGVRRLPFPIQMVSR